MHLTKLCDARPERGEGWGTQTLTDLSWLIDAELGDSEQGAVARMTIEAGGAQEPHRHPDSEEITLVLEGSGTALIDGAWQATEAGNLLYAPAGSIHALAAGADGLDAIVVLSATSAAAAGWELAGLSHGAPSARGARLLSGRETDEIELDDAPSGFLGMNARWLADESICGTSRILVGNSRFAPGRGAHELHRHPKGAEFFVVLSGEGAQLEPDGTEVPVEVGEMVLVPRGSWHGFRNVGTEEVHAVFGFLGATSLEGAGYELPEFARSGS
ncbi:MAG TPA: cupin domain-containing protein [Solirubrobacterales bacterium]